MSFPNGGVASGKPCEYCKVALALVFCRVEEVFMCLSCDAKVHASNRLGSKHARVWVCEVCEQVPAAVMCTADAAALCVTCDRDIHSTNPLAERHERTPLAPLYNTAESGVNSAAAFEHGNVAMDPCISSTVIVDGFLDFDCPVSWESNSQISAPVTNQEKHLEIYFTRSNTTWSSLDVGLVPEGSSVSEMSNWNGGGSVDSGGWNGMCREARVMRYREKRKNRKFQKTIRYASRKAYAETRPRIKGRFAKRIDVESEFDMDTLFSSADSTAGICP